MSRRQRGGVQSIGHEKGAREGGTRHSLPLAPLPGGWDEPWGGSSQGWGDSVPHRALFPRALPGFHRQSRRCRGGDAFARVCAALPELTWCSGEPRALCSDPEAGLPLLSQHTASLRSVCILRMRKHTLDIYLMT